MWLWGLSSGPAELYFTCLLPPPPAQPPQFGLLTDVTELFLMSNELTGAVPSQLGSLLQLQSQFRLEANELASTVPTQLGQLIQMASVYVEWRAEGGGGGGGWA